MNTNKMNINKQTSRSSSKLDDLKSRLKKQIKLTRQGSISDVEILSKQTDALVQEIKQAGILEKPEFKNQWEQLRKLYQELRIATTTQKAGVEEELNHVRKGKKTIETYRKSI